VSDVVLAMHHICTQGLQKEDEHLTFNRGMAPLSPLCRCSVLVYCVVYFDSIELTVSRLEVDYLSFHCMFQINKDPDVALDPFFVVGEEMPKKVWLLTCSSLHLGFIFAC